MTPLGIIFAAAYALSLFKGRRGVLLILACAMPFNDSAAIVAGEATLTPFYLGLFVYLTAAIFSKSDASRTRAPRGALALLLLFTAVQSIISPALFAGTGVVAPGVGLDSQVGALTPLVFSSSSFAQLAYLALNIAFIVFNERDRLLEEKHIAIGLTIGVLVAVVIYVAWRLSLPFPQELFDNSPRGFYARNAERFRGHFSEPSHLGGFALTASAFFVMRTFSAAAFGRMAWNGALVAISALLLVSTSSGTAALGALAALGVVVLVGTTAFFRHNNMRTLRMPVPLFLLGLTAAVVAIPRGGRIAEGIVDMVEGKQGGQSLETRSFTNLHAWQLFLDTWGIGVGLGNNRASSIALMLLSTMGIAGCALFAVILWRATRNGLSDPGRRATAVALATFFSAATVSLADFVAPVMWLAIALCYPPTASGLLRQDDSRARPKVSRQAGQRAP